jgi:hypothetical protein
MGYLFSLRTIYQSVPRVTALSLNKTNGENQEFVKTVSTHISFTPTHQGLNRHSHLHLYRLYIYTYTESINPDSIHTHTHAYINSLLL